VIAVNLSRKIHHLMKLGAIGFQIVKSKVLRKRIPIVVSIHVTNKCNLRCKYCYSNLEDRFSKNLPDFTTLDLKRYIREMRRLGTRWIVFLGGEPLLRKDIGELIHFVNQEGMLCELVTNGTLIDRNIEQIKDVDLLCISIDGNVDTNDIARGNGSYERALNGLIIATKYGIKTRIHAVLSKTNANERTLIHLSKLSATFRTTFGFSTPIVPVKTVQGGTPEYLLTRKQHVNFVDLIKKYKANRKPIYNSNSALNASISRTISLNLTRRKEPSAKIKSGTRMCFAGRRYCYVDSEGFVYPCIESGVTSGLNIRDVGFQQSFEHLKNHRCQGCNHVQHFEANDILDFKPTGILLGIKTILRDSR
jgi:MoaA/NifB/PqqE/SkfB family radical SAM enzyme